MSESNASESSSDERPSQSNLLRCFLREHQGYTKIGLPKLKIHEGEEVYLLQIPKEFNAALLRDEIISLNNKTKIKTEEGNYLIRPEETYEQLLICTDKINKATLIGRLEVEKEVKLRRNKEMGLNKQFQVEFPGDMKMRHPLFGANFKNRLALNESIENELICAEESIVKQLNSEKRKKGKHKNKGKEKSGKSELIYEILGSSLMSAASNKREISRRESKEKLVGPDTELTELNVTLKNKKHGKTKIKKENICKDISFNGLLETSDEHFSYLNHERDLSDDSDARTEIITERLNSSNILNIKKEMTDQRRMSSELDSGDNGTQYIKLKKKKNKHKLSEDSDTVNVLHDIKQEKHDADNFLHIKKEKEDKKLLRMSFANSTSILNGNSSPFHPNLSRISDNGSSFSIKRKSMKRSTNKPVKIELDEDNEKNSVISSILNGIKSEMNLNNLKKRKHKSDDDSKEKIVKRKKIS